MTRDTGGEGTATLEALRRVRGEGSEWPRIQTDPWPQCADHPAVHEAHHHLLDANGTLHPDMGA